MDLFNHNQDVKLIDFIEDLTKDINHFFEGKAKIDYRSCVTEDNSSYMLGTVKSIPKGEIISHHFNNLFLIATEITITKEQERELREYFEPKLLEKEKHSEYKCKLEIGKFSITFLFNLK